MGLIRVDFVDSVKDRIGEGRETGAALNVVHRLDGAVMSREFYCLTQIMSSYCSAGPVAAILVYSE